MTYFLSWNCIVFPAANFRLTFALLYDSVPVHFWYFCHCLAWSAFGWSWIIRFGCWLINRRPTHCAELVGMSKNDINRSIHWIICLALFIVYGLGTRLSFSLHEISKLKIACRLSGLSLSINSATNQNFRPFWFRFDFEGFRLATVTWWCCCMAKAESIAHFWSNGASVSDCSCLTVAFWTMDASSELVTPLKPIRVFAAAAEWTPAKVERQQDAEFSVPAPVVKKKLKLDTTMATMASTTQTETSEIRVRALKNVSTTKPRTGKLMKLASKVLKPTPVRSVFKSNRVLSNRELVHGWWCWFWRQ